MINTTHRRNFPFCQKFMLRPTNSLRLVFVLLFTAVNIEVFAQAKNDVEVLCNTDCSKTIKTFCVINTSLDSLLYHPFTHSVETVNKEAADIFYDDKATVWEWDKNGCGETAYAIVLSTIQEHIYIELINLESQNDIIDLLEGKGNHIYGKDIMPVGCAVYNSYTYFILNDNVPDNVFCKFFKEKNTSIALKRIEENKSLLFTWKENRIYKYGDNRFVPYKPDL